MSVFIRTLLLSFAGLLVAIILGFTASPQQVSITQEPPALQEIIEELPVPTVASTTVVATPEVTKKPIPATPPKPSTATNTVVAPEVAPAQPSLSSSNLNTLARASIVNVLCVTKTGGPLNSISASGVIIDPRGTIVTNAHVGQYFLLRNYPSENFVECTIRTGSPAAPMYTAELLFISPSWIRDNANKINQDRPTGNGEHDYAFLRITGTVHKNILLPSSFPYLPLSVNPPTEGEQVLVAGYPAGFLGGITVQKNLYASSANTVVGELFTFISDTVDLFSLGGTVVSQQGSSGGAAVNGSGSLIGVIATSSDAPDTGSRDLRAITTSYIIADFQKETGVRLGTYLIGNTEVTARVFAQTTAPTLTQILIDAIKNN
ncbi:trypsin-like serine protease [Patescibacteria group bacterium]|nr:MAG: trypsin-like serine protease [Patescibacteria group bacterium]